MRKIFTIILFAFVVVNSQQDLTIPVDFGTYTTGDTVYPANFERNFDTIAVIINRNNDTLDQKFIRYTDLSTHDSTLKYLAVDTIRSKPDVDTLMGNVNGLYIDTVVTRKLTSLVDIVATSDIYTTAWTNYSATTDTAGFASGSTVVVYYKKVGKLVFVEYNVFGTSNSTTASFTLADTCANIVDVVSPVYGQDNTTAITTPGVAVISLNTRVVNFYKDYGLGAWTASGTKQVHGQFFYQAK